MPGGCSFPRTSLRPSPSLVSRVELEPKPALKARRCELGNSMLYTLVTGAELRVLMAVLMARAMRTDGRPPCSDGRPLRPGTVGAPLTAVVCNLTAATPVLHWKRPTVASVLRSDGSPLPSLPALPRPWPRPVLRPVPCPAPHHAHITEKAVLRAQGVPAAASG